MEAAELVAMPQTAARIVPVVQDLVCSDDVESGTPIWTPGEVKDINRGRAYLRAECKRKHVAVFQSVQEALNHIIASSKIAPGNDVV